MLLLLCSGFFCTFYVRFIENYYILKGNEKVDKQNIKIIIAKLKKKKQQMGEEVGS